MSEAIEEEIKSEKKTFMSRLYNRNEENKRISDECDIYRTKKKKKNHSKRRVDLNESESRNSIEKYKNLLAYLGAISNRHYTKNPKSFSENIRNVTDSLAPISKIKSGYSDDVNLMYDLLTSKSTY